MKTDERQVMVCTRMTDAEMATLREMMLLEGYTSRSRFIRDHLFSRPVRRKIIAVTTADVSRQVVQMATDLRKIGINVNQLTKRFNTLSKIQNKEGKPVVNTDSVTRVASSVESLFNQAVSGLEDLASAVNNNIINQTPSQSMQTITITGNLCADAEVRQSGDVEMMSFKVAVNERRGEEETKTFYSCSMRKTGVLQFLKKGRKVLVSGDFCQKVVEKDGKTYVNSDIRVSKLELLSSGSVDDLPE